MLEGLENHAKEEKEAEEEVLEAVENENEETKEPVVEKKPKTKKKSFFEKFTDGLKEFLDNAE